MLSDEEEDEEVSSEEMVSSDHGEEELNCPNQSEFKVHDLHQSRDLLQQSDDIQHPFNHHTNPPCLPNDLECGAKHEDNGGSLEKRDLARLQYQTNNDLKNGGGMVNHNPSPSTALAASLKKPESHPDKLKSILVKRRGNKSNKNVSFRNILADFVEPVPVNHVNDEECANVLDSYKELCEKLRVRPCQKLVDQLEGLQDSTLKLDTIDLKGTRLDPSHCEALEAVLRVLRAQTLNIEQTQLDDDGAISVFEMIEYYEPITRLIVANNVRLGVRAWLALARLLKRFHRLEYLDVRRTSLDESTMPLLCRVLKLNCTLRVLHLEDNHLSGILTRNLGVPVLLYNSIYRRLVAQKLSPELRAYFDHHVAIFAHFAMFINAMSNAFLYYISLDSFRVFVNRRVLLWVNRIRGCRTN